MEDDDALTDDELTLLDSLLQLELDALDTLVTLLGVDQLELDADEIPNSISSSIPRGSASIELTSRLVLRMLVNCPDCKYNLLDSEPDHGVLTPSQLIPVGTASIDATLMLVFITLVNWPLCK